MYRYAAIQQATAEAPPASAPYTRDDLRTASRDPRLAPLVDTIREAARRAEPLPDLPYRLFRTYPHTGDRARYENRYFARRGALNAAAITAMIDGGAEDLAHLQDVVWEICNEFSWAVPAHHRFNTTLDLGYDRCIDLFASETAHTLAEIIAVLGDEMDDAVTRRVRDEVERRVLSPFLDDPRPRWWETSLNNWAAVCGGAVGMAGLALENDPLRLAALIERVQRTMEYFLAGFGPDGGCVEGMDYWVYGYGYFTYYAEALRHRTGLDLLADTGHIARFPAAVDFGGGNCVSFSDGSDNVVPPTGLMSRLAARLSAPMPHITRLSEFGDDHCHRWGHLSRTLLWTDPGVVGRPAPTGTVWLADLAWLIARGAGDGTPVALAAKGGHNDEPHNHLDLGSFLLAVDGEQLLADLGAGVYDKDYFGERRYEALHTSARGHSVPVIGGVTQRPGPDSRARILEQRTDGDAVSLALDLSSAYDGAGFRRRFDWDGGGILRLADEFDDPGVPLVETFISRHRPSTAEGRVEWHGARGVARMEFTGDWTATVEEIATRDHHARPETVYRLDLTGLTAPRHEFHFTVTPS
ncbi:heparinase II/III-like protein [Stackebrandtia albiflava]|uniref:Heparinase II/III-like protein n=1 Tax=Stackebrandtia albiflava TaxID=406432 RepID=A0A562VAK0_9ACTN|nr:heparinase II/III family protein [Stackebrandtia albiflava]TWJ14895.1 heparinase II/III-like protein [Stackebrandtia albiflava]